MFVKLTSFNLPICLTKSAFLSNDIEPVLLLQFSTLNDMTESKIAIYFPNIKIHFKLCYPSTSRVIRMKFGWDINAVANLNISGTSRLLS